MDRSNKLKLLGLDKDIKLPDNYIDLLYNSLNNLKDNNDKQIVKKTSSKIIKETDPKYKILLKFVNEINVNINKPVINKLTDFINIDREDIIKQENNVSFQKMENDIFEYFDKKVCGWYRRKTIKGYILTFLRSTCKDIGLEFKYNQKEICDIINNKSYRRTHLMYSIC